MAHCHADMAFLDPPYNVRIGGVVGRGRTKHAEFAMASGEPELGTADFTELRKVLRPFPKDAGRDCYHHLVEQMQATPDRPHRRKAEFEEFCRRRFHVTVESFDYCWREAIKVTGARWDQPGRPPR
jgi:hypothetical protein